MKRLPLLFLGLMLLMTACGDASRRGEAAGRDFLAAWGDTAAMRQSVQRFNALRNDSLLDMGGQGGQPRVCRSVDG